jgi:hypothetical protein
MLHLAWSRELASDEENGLLLCTKVVDCLFEHVIVTELHLQNLIIGSRYITVRKRNPSDGARLCCFGMQSPTLCYNGRDVQV